ncbi:hypothetical protein [Bosea sp. WAO]|uniref:hypothetical protein n=1 Tax=Bosea sp. WAO TaxID=406341 RepID=UPI00082A18A8|nr:hypothetical protein [Bosea sp. WAO]
MAFKLGDRIRENTTTTGTGDLTLTGADVGFATFNSRLSTNDTTWYALVFGANWEVGIGTFTAPATLARTTIIASSNSDAALNLGAGTKEVFITVPAQALSLLTKLQTVTSARFMGRKTAGAGPAEELTRADAADMLQMGSELIASGVGPTGGGVIVLPLTSSFRFFKFLGSRLEPTTAGQLLQMQVSTDGVPNFQTGANYHYDGQSRRAGAATVDWQSTTDDKFALSAALNAAGSNMADLVMEITNSSGVVPEFDWKMKFRRQTSNEKSTVLGSGYFSGDTSRWTHARLSFNSGNVSSDAVWRLYGWR